MKMRLLQVPGLCLLAVGSDETLQDASGRLERSFQIGREGQADTFRPRISPFPRNISPQLLQYPDLSPDIAILSCSSTSV